MLLWLSPLLLPTALPIAHDDTMARLNASLASVERFAVNRSMGAWVGVQTPDFSYGAGFGFSDIGPDKVRATASDIIPAGSITKSFISAYIMHLVERGEMKLEDPVYKRVDAFLAKINGTTLLKLWNNDSSIQKVTVGQLLHMSSGIVDYNDTQIWEIAQSRPDYDIPPQEFLHLVNKTFACKPGTCQYYSSINYVLAGMVLAQFQGCSSWDELDQKAFLDKRTQEKYKDVVFMMKGPCGQYPHMVHTYAWNHSIDNATGSYLYNDMISKSCLNGWTMGNIAVSTKDLASFYFDLLSFPSGYGQDHSNSTVLSGWSKLQMMQMAVIGDEDPWGYGINYGYGVFDLTPGNLPKTDATMPHLIGHGGADYGTYMIGGWHPALNIGISIAINKDVSSEKEDIEHVFCLGYRSIFEVIANVTVACRDLPDVFRTHHRRHRRIRAL